MVKAGSRKRWWMLAGILGALGVLLVAWFLVAPTGGVESISREDAEGVWQLESPEGHTMTLELASDGTFSSVDWLTQLGCGTPPQGLSLTDLQWGRRSVVVGTWDERLGGSQLWVTGASGCEFSRVFLMDRNYLTGDLYLKKYIDGFQVEDQFLRFVKVRP